MAYVIIGLSHLSKVKTYLNCVFSVSKAPQVVQKLTEKNIKAYIGE